MISLKAVKKVICVVFNKHILSLLIGVCPRVGSHHHLYFLQRGPDHPASLPPNPRPSALLWARFLHGTKPGQALPGAGPGLRPRYPAAAPPPQPTNHPRPTAKVQIFLGR